MVYLRNVFMACHVCRPHPNPDESPFFSHWEAFDAGKCGNAFLSRGFTAGTGAVKGQAVVATLNMIALQTPHGQRQLSVGAGIFQSHRYPTRISIKHDGLRKQCHGLQRLRQLM